MDSRSPEDKTEEKMEVEDTSSTVKETPKKRRLSISQSTSDLPSGNSSSLFFVSSDSALNIPKLEDTKQIKLETSFSEEERESLLTMKPHLGLENKGTNNVNQGKDRAYVNAYLSDTYSYKEIFKNDNDQYLDNKGNPLDGDKMFIIVKDNRTNQLYLIIGNTIQVHFYLAIDKEKMAERVKAYKEKNPGLSPEILKSSMREHLDLSGMCMEVVAAGELHFKKGKLPRLTVQSGCYHIPPTTPTPERDIYLNSMQEAINKFEMLKGVKTVLDFEEMKKITAKRNAKKQKPNEPQSQKEEETASVNSIKKTT